LDGRKECSDGLGECSDGLGECSDGRRECTDGLGEASDGRRECTDGLGECSDERRDASDGRKERGSNARRKDAVILHTLNPEYFRFFDLDFDVFYLTLSITLQCLNQSTLYFFPKTIWR